MAKSYSRSKSSLKTHTQMLSHIAKKEYNFKIIENWHQKDNSRGATT